jgi:hypothetical protein
MPRTPGRFATRVVTRGVSPQLYCTYKSSRLKQYFKLGTALRTETVIGDTRDFGIGRRVCATNWTGLRAVGDSANRRLCDAELQTAQPTPDVVTLTHVTRPSTTTDGLHAPALAFGDSRVMALLAALVLFTPYPRRFRQPPTGQAGPPLLGPSPLQSAGHLRSSSPASQGTDHPVTALTPLPPHAIRTPRRRPVHQSAWPSPRSWLRPARSDTPAGPRPTQPSGSRLA